MKAGCPHRIASFLAAGIVLSAGRTGAEPLPAGIGPASSRDPGNYCVACHTLHDLRPTQVLVWGKGLGRGSPGPCPASNRVREEIYLTERLLLAIARSRAALGWDPQITPIDTRVNDDRQTYGRLLDAPIASLEAFVSDASSLRLRLGRSYSALNAEHAALERRRTVIVAGVISLAILALLVRGWYLTRRFTAGNGSRHCVTWRATLLMVGVFALSSLPVLDAGEEELQASGEDAQVQQRGYDAANRLASASDRALGRAWMLARVGAAWTEVDLARGETVLGEALQAATMEPEADALWGQGQAVREATAGSLSAQTKAARIVDRLDAVRSRVWGLRLVATEAAATDPGWAASVLETALEHAQAVEPYRDLDVRAIAATWATLDPDYGAAVAEDIRDPGLRAWALREIATVASMPALFDRAAQAARRVTDPAERARALQEIAKLSGRPGLFREALAALGGVEGRLKAYAWSELAAASGDKNLARRIDIAYPQARARAFYHLGALDAAWTAARAITDPFARDWAFATLATATRNKNAARQIGDPTLRDRALCKIAVAQRDLALVRRIESAYYRTEALTALGHTQAALKAVEGVKDGFARKALALASAQIDGASAVEIAEGLRSESDKAEVLRVLAVASDEGDLFERALGLALAARVRGDALSQAKASLALGQALGLTDITRVETALAQAHAAARRIPTQ